MKTSEAELKKEKLFVGLGSTFDLSKWEFFSTNQKIDELFKPNSLIYFEVVSLKEASILTRKFITHFSLSSSNWTGGVVLNDDQKFTANISYNGRIWGNENLNIAKEISV